ncbi:MAG TPA: FG-GAP-like repeat-containing protein [Nitrospiria bacterium]|nr:FG-GAP-like repeat-containing protein [Nitrospiria bacterium]
MPTRGGGDNTGGIRVPSVGYFPAATHQPRITIFGTKSAGTAIFMDGFLRVARDSNTTWSTAVDLTIEGLNTFTFDAMDVNGSVSDPLTVSITRDTNPPLAPAVSFPSSWPTNPVTISGTKEAGTFIRLNGRRISLLSDDTNWAYQVTLSPGPNTLSLTAVDAAGNESGPVTGAVTLTASGCVAPPRLVAPLDGRSIAWGHAFSWTHVPVGTYVFELSASPAFENPLQHQAPVAGALQYAPVGLVPPNGVYYWRVGVQDACGTSYSPTRKVILGAMTGDVTGDGFADIFVGAYTDARAGDGAGAAYLYRGGAVQDVTADAVFRGRQSGGTFGASVAKVGDIDGDGYVDLLVGAPRADRDSAANDDTGAAYLYWGGPTPSASPALTFRGETDGSIFGMSVAGVGDINGDGFPDIAIGAYQTPVTAECNGGTARLPIVGRVYVFFGGPRDQMDNFPDVVLSGETTEIPNDRSSQCRSRDEFGLSVAGVGDVNGDGYDDIAVGARGYDTSLSPPAGLDTGRAYVFYGGPWLVGVGADRADVVLTGLAENDQFGAAVAGSGDTNGDGLADLLVGAHLSDLGGSDSGAAFWYFGESSGGMFGPVQLSGAVAGDSFGASMASAGDINGDGYADFMIGAYLVGATPNDIGAVSYFLGNSAGTVSPAGTISGETTPNTGDQFGLAVAGAGDVDGNGFDDTVVGATEHDVCVIAPLPPGVCFNAGRAYVILGPTITNRGAAADPKDWLLTGLTSDDRMGSSVN